MEVLIEKQLKILIDELCLMCMMLKQRCLDVETVKQRRSDIVCTGAGIVAFPATFLKYRSVKF